MNEKRLFFDAEEPRKVVTFNLDFSIVVDLDRLAINYRRSRSEVLNMILKAYFQKDVSKGAQL